VRDLPSGTVTFLFTDIEGSTRLLRELGDGYGAALVEHRRVLRDAVEAHGGVEVDTQGDAFFVAFTDATEAVAAAAEGQAALGVGPLRVRMGLHTGRPRRIDEGYVGEDVHLGARIAAAAHGGQVVLSKATRDLIDGDVIDLGEHRVKDFEQPVWIFQLGDEAFPPLKTISNTNLPRPASGFVGREREVEAVQRLLRESRLVTLTGPGGSGKTRLAIEAASELVGEFRNGVFWVGVATIHDPELVQPTVAQTIGAQDGLAAHVGEKELLLLLDNLEQVVSVAPELASLVEACPNLTLLVTSRELLRVRGEVEYEVLPLAAPDAVELFCARAQISPSAAVEELCSRLDNMPLALELAAARTKALSPEQILERLGDRLDLLKGGRDAEPRQATLRATIAWSYDLLSPGEATLFCQLAVFVGGCTLEAAEAVCDADLDALQSLVEKSLLRHTNERFWMLETVREYAAEGLEQSREAEELRRRHAEHFLALAESAASKVVGPEQPRWLTRLTEDQGNLRAALGWSFAAGDASIGTRLVLALRDFWHLRTQVAEAGRWYEQALVEAEAAPPEVRAEVFWSAGWFRFFEDAQDFAAAESLYEQALAVYRARGDRGGEAWVLVLQTVAADARGDLPRARAALDDALAVRHEVPEALQGRMLHLLGEVARDLGQTARAEALLGDALATVRFQGNEAHGSEILHGLGDLALAEHHEDDAASRYGEALRIAARLGHGFTAAYCLAGIASVAGKRGDAAAAGRLWGGAERVQELFGVRLLPHDRSRYERYLEGVCEDRSFAAAAAESAKGSSLEEVVRDALRT
jgi:predicted ATPase